MALRGRFVIVKPTLAADVACKNDTTIVLFVILLHVAPVPLQASLRVKGVFMRLNENNSYSDHALRQQVAHVGSSLQTHTAVTRIR